MPEPIHVLVVAADDRERLLLETLLSRMGDHYQVVAVRTAQAALKAAQHMLFSVLLMDLKRPQMGGLSLTQAFSTQYPQTAIIWITAYECYLYQHIPLPIFRCLDKPVDIAEIREAVLAAGGQE